MWRSEIASWISKVNKVLFAVVLCAVVPFSVWADDVSNAKQPIDFPHARHAGKFKINCMYCHSGARRSKVAGIPPTEKCIGCHSNLPSVRETPRIKKLFDYWEKKEPIPWLKVHDLPDFVEFNHKRHVQRFIFKDGRSTQQTCGMCHGDVKTMSVAKKIRPLTMGWCLSCHEQFQGDSDIGLPKPAKRWLIPAADTDLPIMQVDHPQLAVMDSSQPATMKASEVKAMSERLPKALKEKFARAPHDCWQCHK